MPNRTLEEANAQFDAMSQVLSPALLESFANELQTARSNAVDMAARYRDQRAEAAEQLSEDVRTDLGQVGASGTHFDGQSGRITRGVQRSVVPSSAASGNWNGEWERFLKPLTNSMRLKQTRQRGRIGPSTDASHLSGRSSALDAPPPRWLRRTWPCVSPWSCRRAASFEEVSSPGVLVGFDLTSGETFIEDAKGV